MSNMIAIILVAALILVIAGIMRTGMEMYYLRRRAAAQGLDNKSVISLPRATDAYKLSSEYTRQRILERTLSNIKDGKREFCISVKTECPDEATCWMLLSRGYDMTYHKDLESLVISWKEPKRTKEGTASIISNGKPDRIVTVEELCKAISKQTS